MWSIKNIFGRNIVQQTAPCGEEFTKGFEILREEILRIGKAQGRERAKNSVSLNNKDARYDAGTKEWVRVENDALYIRYYDKKTKSCESLYVFSIDRERERFVLQRAHEFDDAQEAIGVFVNLLEDYADASFMRALKESLVEKNIIQYPVYDGESGVAEPALNLTSKAPQVMPPIK
jgi:hypothetical protein